MKKIVTTAMVDLALSTLGPEDLRQVHAWLGHLANWENDPYLKKNSHELSAEPGVFVLHTTSDLRIFFRLDNDTITVLDVAKKQAIMMTASRGENH